MSTVEIVKVQSHSVQCSGKEAPLDHPRVFLEIDEKEGSVTCPYCSKQFLMIS